MPDTVLAVSNLSKTFGGVTALDNVSIEFTRSKVTSVVGPNGSGKSTLINCITGFERPNSGHVLANGHSLDRASRRRRVQAGLRRTFQAVDVFPELTVMDHLLLAQQELQGPTLIDEVLRTPRLRRVQAQARANAERTLETVTLTQLRDNQASALSYGQQKLLGLGCALVADPVVLFLDEPMAGVSPVLRESLLEVLSEIRDTGTTMVIVEHDMDFVAQISDWIVVMAEGRVIASGGSAILRHNELVFHTLMGGAP